MKVSDSECQEERIHVCSLDFMQELFVWNVDQEGRRSLGVQIEVGVTVTFGFRAIAIPIWRSDHPYRVLVRARLSRLGNFAASASGWR